MRPQSGDLSELHLDQEQSHSLGKCTSIVASSRLYCFIFTCSAV